MENLTDNETNQTTLAFEAVKSFFAIEPSLRKVQEIGPQTRLLDGGLDSLGFLRLVTHLDETINIVVDDEDFTPENFETVGSLVRFIIKKNGTRS